MKILYSIILFVSVMLIILVILFVGCWKSLNTTPEKCTKTLLFPEWEHSSSSFERNFYTNIYVVYSNGYLYTKFLQKDGSFTDMWKNDTKDKTVYEAKQAFGLNIQWNVQKCIHDSLSK